jgi:hypothetical protein
MDFRDFLEAVKTLWPIFSVIVLCLLWIFNKLGKMFTEEDCNKCRKEQTRYIDLQVSQIKGDSNRVEKTLSEFRAEVKQDLGDLRTLIIDTIKSREK